MAVKGDYTSVMTLGIFREESAIVSPAVGDVEEGVEYGDGGSEFTGTFGVPSESNVNEGVQYGADGVEFTGTLVSELDYDPEDAAQDLNDSPAFILTRFLIAQGELIIPGESGTWPVYTGALPDGGNVEHNAVVGIDTAGVGDGRIMNGSPLFHHGVQLMIRSTDYNVGYAKAAALAEELAVANQTAVDVGDDTYVIHAIKQTSSVTSLGQEPESKRRYLFSVNFTATIRKA